jgi:multidrug efflux pump subunit AcrA (membrane-fusion protein)
MNLVKPFLVAAALAVPLAGVTLSSDSSQAIVPDCQVLLINDVDVPAEAPGRLLEMNVTEGGRIEKGMLAAQIDDREPLLQKVAAQLERDAAHARANDDIEVRYSIKAFEVAEAELNRSLEINRRNAGSIPAAEIKRQQLERTRAELQIDRSRLDLKVAEMTANVQNAAVQAADDAILRRRILVPFNGQVLQIYRQTGEWVAVGEPVLRVVRLDRLRVDGFIDGLELNVAEIANRPVTVEVELARGRKEQFRGQVVFVNPLVQAGARYRVRAEVENRVEDEQWLLNPGAMAKMVIHLR